MAEVVNVDEKARRDRVRYGTRRRTKVNRRWRVETYIGDIETGLGGWPGKEPSGCLLTGWVVSGMKAA